MYLLLHDLQDLHGAGLDADAAGDALGGGILRLQDHNLHGTCFHALAAGNAVLLIDHVNTGLGILGNGIVFTDLHAFAALDTDIRFRTAILTGNDLNAGIIGMEFLVKCLGAGIHTGKTCHAFHIFLNSELLHNGQILLYVLFISLLL